MWRIFIHIAIIMSILGNVSIVSAADLSVNQLRNSKYFIPGFEDPSRGEWVQVQNGSFARRNQDNPLFVAVVKIAMGSLTNSGTQDAAVIYGYNTGGSGFFTMLCAIRNNNGQPQILAYADLGDRVKINSLSIQAGKIIIDMVTHGPNDPSCCPTVKKIAQYSLQGNKLVEN